ncbi:MAG TPA: SDR family oxidoreductase [Chloroflexia bacterium]|nr:SDR family oxidoreductase [Chloroflexia bacterium]
MHILGRGFIASNFACLSELHARTVLFAAGVSNSRCLDEAEFHREIVMLDDAIRHCRVNDLKLVYFSSSGLVYGGYPGYTQEDGPSVPNTAYGKHKLAMERAIQASGVDYLILRLANVVGPDQKGHQLVPALYAQMQRGVVVVWKGAHRDIIDIADVVRITERLLAQDVSRQVLNVASGVSVPVEDIVAHLEASIGSPVTKQYIDCPDSYAVCIDKLKKTLGAANMDVFGFDTGYYKRVISKYY